MQLCKLCCFYTTKTTEENFDQRSVYLIRKSGENVYQGSMHHVIPLG